MKLSTRSRYGLRAVTELAGHYDDGVVSMDDIAAQQNLSRKYLDTLFTSLKVAGLAMSRRGPGGGWRLTRPPSEIRLTEVLLALEGSLGMVQCVEHPHACSRTERCAAREVYVAIHDAILGVLDQYTLLDIHERGVELDELCPDLHSGSELCETASLAG
jgi:Rrf2 family transcriptional regulator, cysteine metabolism repressor